MIPEDEQSLEAIDNWVERNADNLPSDYETFTQHSPAYRRVIYSKLDNEAKGSLWSAQFDSHISKQRRVAPEKLALFQEVKDFFASPTLNEDRLKEIEDKVKVTFDEDEAQALFGQLDNGDQGVEGNDEGQHMHSLRGEHSFCDCSVGSYWACYGLGFTFCRVDSGCMPPCKTDGCGFLGYYPCNGLCDYS